MERKAERKKEKIGLIAVLIVVSCFLTYYFHVVLELGTVFSHFFYVPIILSSIWWQRKGLAVAIFLASFLILSHIFFSDLAETYNDYFRALMFVVIAFVVSWLSERLTKSEKELRKSLERSRAFLNATTNGAVLLDRQGIIHDINNAFAQRFHKSFEEMIGLYVGDLFPTEMTDNRKKNIKEVFESGKPVSMEDEQNGVWHYTNIYPICDSRGEVMQVSVFAHDITERKLVEKALWESEAQKRTILDASVDRLRCVDKDMKIIWANKATAIDLDMSPEDLVGRFCYKLFIGRDTPCKGCPTIKARETGKREQAVMYQPKVKGIEGESYWDTYCVPLKNDAGEIESFIQIARNITDQKRAEEHIRALTQNLMKAQESERQMISRELHDRVAQELSTVKIGCDTLLDGQTAISNELKDKISKNSKLVEQTIAAVRDLAYDLRPPSLDEMGIVKALEIYCEEFLEKSGLKVDFQSAGMKDLKMDFDTEIHLYRLAQEGLNNIRKHAAAERATIKLIGASPNIILRIEDKGKGFDVRARDRALNNEKRMGLRSMQERVNLLQGRMTIESRPGKGTTIVMNLPIRVQNGNP
ncbi:MAG: PAS domain-containing protein [Desulfobacterales bacterium]|uniref:PAS domain-containing protein n=1 Tax=Candidatus Desulfatibia vada TaxID=2841696 RepID=A0A8J6TKD6_9BACT|nr:PAS domain-containing protein [Candidatus Desulfatibia vada]